MMCWQSIVEGGGQDAVTVIEEEDGDEDGDEESANLQSCAYLYSVRQRSSPVSEEFGTILLAIMAMRGCCSAEANLRAGMVEQLSNGDVLLRDHDSIVYANSFSTGISGIESFECGVKCWSSRCQNMQVFRPLENEFPKSGVPMAWLYHGNVNMHV